METSPLPAPVVTWLVATSTPVNRSVKLLLAASTSTILALGAMACAHSISSAASCAQPQLALGLEPAAKTFLKHGATLPLLPQSGMAGSPSVERRKHPNRWPQWHSHR